MVEEEIKGSVVRIEDKGDYVELTIQVEKEFMEFKWEKFRLGEIRLVVK